MSSDDQHRPRYALEVAALSSTYTRALADTTGVSALRTLLTDHGRHGCFVVGSGGALAAAQAVSQLHIQRYRQFAQALTPLELSSIPAGIRAGCIVLSSRARHQDTSLAVTSAVAAGLDPITVLTHNADLSTSSFPGARVFTLPSPAISDGFLATNSLMSMIAYLCRAYDYPLPALIDPAKVSTDSRPRSRILVLFNSATKPIAYDLEARLHETGLASVQLTDFRNFAHGRHSGLMRHLDDTTVLSFESAADPFWDKLFSQLPERADVRRVSSSVDWPGCLPNLLVASASIPLSMTESTKDDPSRPHVPDFGRRLYHLTYHPPSRTTNTQACDHKTAAIARLGHEAPSMQDVREALYTWLDFVESQAVGGLVLDYDGTIVGQQNRFEPPSRQMASRISQLLRAGLSLGVATGRGGSVHKDLRSVLPKSLWPRVVLGLYNGSVLVSLDESLPELKSQHGFTPSNIASVARSAINDLRLSSCKIAERATQVTIEIDADTNAISARSKLIEALTSDFHGSTEPIKIVASGHSVDIVHGSTSKVAVQEQLRLRTEFGILAIGDQGAPGGNDAEMLDVHPLTLSVDAVSPALDRCWRLSTDTVGSRLLLLYLNALRAVDYGVARFDLDSFK